LTKSRPGILAYDFGHYKALEQETPEDNPRLDWSFVEMAIEFHSSGAPLTNDVNEHTAMLPSTLEIDQILIRHSVSLVKIVV